MIESCENLIPLAKAARLVPGRGGDGVHVATVWRWTTRGVGGHVLKSWKVVGQRFTSQAAVDEFIAACNGESHPASVPSKAAEKRIAAAEAQCEALGV